MQFGRLRSISAKISSWDKNPRESPPQVESQEMCPWIHVVLTQRIGADSHNGKVYLYKPPLCGGEYAIKIIQPRKGFERYAIREQRIASLLGSSEGGYFPRLLALGKCEDNFYIVTEKLSASYLKTKDFLMQLVYAVHEMNTKYKVAHNDLHVNNVMSREGKPVIIDFGSASEYTLADGLSDLESVLSWWGVKKSTLQKISEINVWDLKKIFGILHEK
jgi:serine/threonine protein kinase